MDSGQQPPMRTMTAGPVEGRDATAPDLGGPRIAERIARLGAETAFAVSAEAAAFAAQGHDLYPFHLGDMNIPTPTNIVEASFKAIRDGKTGYCPDAGIPVLRAALAADVNASHGTSYEAENVAIQPGGKPVIGKFILALMNPGDEVLYPNPGYPIYESQIEFHGGIAEPYGYYQGENGFVLDLDALEASITERTRLLIVNDLQNPLGAELSFSELERLADIVLRHDLTVLCDEAYFDIRYSGVSTSLVSFPGMADRTVILYTFSKKFAMTGWRLGAAIGPREIIRVIAKLNVNDESCPNHFIQYGALEGLTGDQSGPLHIVSVLRERRDASVAILNDCPGINCYTPNATFYLFPNVSGAMRLKGITDVEAFRRAVLHHTGVSLCSRVHFGRPLPGETENYVRLAYSGIDTSQIIEGLTKLRAYLEDRDLPI
ncbi:MAG: aminotransferase class I/II-fold pyridoxal phosphate-dependent enzyme [Acidimicrobiales bacterium]